MTVLHYWFIIYGTLKQSGFYIYTKSQFKISGTVASCVLRTYLPNLIILVLSVAMPQAKFTN